MCVDYDDNDDPYNADDYHDDVPDDADDEDNAYPDDADYNYNDVSWAVDDACP